LRRIAILLHEQDHRAEETHYILWAIRAVWIRRGIEVVTLRGVDEAPEADLLIPHLDMSVIPTAYARFIERYPRVLNRGVRDVSKSAVSRNLVRPGDGWEGPVIVKTDRNCGGLPERRLHGKGRERRAAARHLLRRLTGRPSHPLASATVIDPREYPVFESVRALPRGVFENRALVVERFLPERIDGRYFLRNYSFLGTRHISFRRGGPDPVVKAIPGVPLERVPVPPELVEERRRLGFDFGKLDFVIHQGRPVLLDANPTPTFAGDRLTPEHRKRAEWLAEGIFPAR
jgi:hypothetical protein